MWAGSGRIDRAAGIVTGENYRICERRRTIRRIVLLFTAFLLLIAANPYHAPERDGIVGSWNTEEHDAIIEIFNCGQKYCGRIKWLRAPYYNDDDGSGRAGKPKVDDKNPNPELRGRPLVGTEILHDFSYAGRNIWNGGKIYNPENGKTYKGMITLLSPDTLHLRGFFVISLLGETTEWTRAAP